MPNKPTTLSPQDKTKMEKANPHKPVNDVRFKAIDMSYKTGLHDGFNKGYTAAMHAHDAEIADLREKCDKLAGQLLKVNAERTEPDKLYIITGRSEFREAVQIAREVKG